MKNCSGKDKNIVENVYKILRVEIEIGTIKTKWEELETYGVRILFPLDWTSFLLVSPQFGRCEEPGVLLPAALLWPLQTSCHRLDAAVSARPRPAHVRTHRHGLTSPPPHAQGQGWDFYSGCGPKAQSVFIYFFKRTVHCEGRPRYKKHRVDIVRFSCSLYRLLLPYTWPMLVK